MRAYLGFRVQKSGDILDFAPSEVSQLGTHVHIHWHSWGWKYRKRLQQLSKNKRRAILQGKMTK
jgi:hypothetical protein